MDPFVGEIRAIGFNFAPRGWALCQGQLVSISQNTALFSLLGTQYGGDGRTTFALPDLRGRAVVQTGQGPGLSSYVQGQISGTENVTLLTTQMPAHIHATTTATLPTNSGATGSTGNPSGAYLAIAPTTQYGEEYSTLAMAANSVTGTTSIAGGGVAHSNMMPYLAMYYIICLSGVFPQRQ